jgi:putative transposase
MMHLPQRRSIRLRDYDYSQSAAYFVTICAHNRRCLFGGVQDGEMAINAWGQMLQICWDEIPVHFPRVELDAFVVMPNHIHGVVLILDDPVTNPVGATHGSPSDSQSPSGPKQGSLSAIVGQFKSSVSRRIKTLSNPPDHPLWQRNYHEHIIRSEKSLNQIRDYVATNPAKWADDSLYSVR